jgi:hypothetical protein
MQQPDDRHLYLRDRPMLAAVVNYTACDHSGTFRGRFASNRHRNHEER